MINILFLLMCLAVVTNTPIMVDGIQNTSNENLELERQVKLLNKLPVKSIHTKFGYIVDCIDINKQPAFDHPLLKNHKLQRKPSFWKTKSKTGVNLSSSKSKARLEKIVCPKGTVPIRRTTKNDLIQSKKLLDTQILAGNTIALHKAEVSLVIFPGNPFYAVSGSNSIYNPRVNKDQTSSSHIFVQKGQGGGTNKIVVGWHVDPTIYGDDATYIYSLWTSDNFQKTGCYNLLCPGFVETAGEMFIGERVVNTSIIDRKMAEIRLSLVQDDKTKNWWLNIDFVPVGYFPAALFSDLASADEVGWGGTTTTPVGIRSPPMGSGLFPDNNFVHACYFTNVSFQNQLRQDTGPNKNNQNIKTFTDTPKCYGVEYYGDQGGQAGYSLQFGGPGGDC